MYICICNAHTEKDIVRLVEEGYRTVDAIYGALGGLPRCQQCIDFAEMLVDKAVAKLAEQSETAHVTALSLGSGD